MDDSPQDIYRAEKEKALRERRISHVQLMAEAQEAFKKMLADAQMARKGGRPKGSPNAAAAAAKKKPGVVAAPAEPASDLAARVKVAPAKRVKVKPKAKTKARSVGKGSSRPRSKVRKGAKKNVARKPRGRASAARKRR